MRATGPRRGSTNPGVDVLELGCVEHEFLDRAIRKCLQLHALAAVLEEIDGGGVTDESGLGVLIALAENDVRLERAASGFD